MRRLAAARQIFVGLPVWLVCFYLAVTAFNLLAFNQGDINHTVGSSYAYLNGHWQDFYDYNKIHFQVNDYYPTVYLIFAAWMAPVKLILSPGVQNGGSLTAWEIAWAKTLLLLIFWSTVYIITLIAKELFPTRPHARRNVRIAYLLSPFAAFAFNVIGQYDVIGVFFTMLGLLFYLRGDKWKFALFFGLAASCKYFALALFLPLLLLQFKKLTDIIRLSIVAGSVVAIEAAIYFNNSAFRDRTLFGLAGSKFSANDHQTITTFLGLLLAVGCVLLWRIRPTAESLGPLAIFSGALTYGLVFEIITWNPQWFMILTPFFALSIGFLRKPSRFLLWEASAFVAFIWLVVDRWPGNVDIGMVSAGAFRSLLGRPGLQGSDLYPPAAVPVTAALIVLYCVSPAIFYLFELVSRRTTDDDDVPVRTSMWIVRASALPIAFTIPAMLAVWLPVSIASEFNPNAAALRMTTVNRCTNTKATYGEIADGVVARQSFTADGGSLGAVSVLVGTYGRHSDGELTLRLLADGRDVAHESVDLSTFLDNSRAYLILDAPLRGTGPTPYTLEILTSNIPAGAGVALWGSDTDCFSPGALTVGADEKAGDINLMLHYAE